MEAPGALASMFSPGRTFTRAARGESEGDPMGKRWDLAEAATVPARGAWARRGESFPNTENCQAEPGRLFTQWPLLAFLKKQPGLLDLSL